MKAKVNVAVVGFGRIGQIYAQTVAHSARARLYSVADPLLAERAQLLTEYTIPHLLQDPYDALALPDLRAVIIAAPTSAHADLIVAAARAGKVIFYEKPLALTLQESRCALDGVQRAGIRLQVSVMGRFDAAHQEACASPSSVVRRPSRDTPALPSER